MKTSLTKSKYVLLALLIAFSFSCSPEDGNDGAPGEQGISGQNGSDGTDGIDGNANVQTYIFNNPTWVSGENYLEINIPAITANVMTNDVILGYVNINPYNIANPIPGIVSSYQQYGVNIFPTGRYIVSSIESNGLKTPVNELRALKWVKIIIIESNNTTTTNGNGRVVNGKEAVLQELRNAGIDINNYKDVCDYYGIAY